jgi:hypothetical protein
MGEATIATRSGYPLLAASSSSALSCDCSVVETPASAGMKARWTARMSLAGSPSAYAWGATPARATSPSAMPVSRWRALRQPWVDLREHSHLCGLNRYLP